MMGAETIWRVILVGLRGLVSIGAPAIADLITGGQDLDELEAKGTAAIARLKEDRTAEWAAKAEALKE